MDTGSSCMTGYRSFKTAGSTKYRRLLAGTMAIVVLVTVMFSIAFIAVESGHDCCGEECHICACIRMCEKNISRIRTGSVTGVKTAVDTHVVFLIVPVFVFEVVFGKESPVTSKIRLNI